MKIRERNIFSEEEMLQLGQQLADNCPNKIIIYLQGQLGAGKTTLVRGFLRGLGYEGTVKSPTYTLVEEYTIADKLIYHFDLYRCADPGELEFIGIRDYIQATAICLIEWPEQGKGYLPKADLIINISLDNQGRSIKLMASSLFAQDILNKLVF